MSFSAVFQRTFEEVSKETKHFSVIESLIYSEEVSLSEEFDDSLIQDSWSWRNVTFARNLSNFLIEETGDLSFEKLVDAIECLKRGLYSLGPRRYHDSKRQEHALRILQWIQKDKELLSLLKKSSKPFQNNLAEQYIRRSLFLPETTPVTDALTRRAVLCTLLTYLRQTVGSCFATAPAIYIQLYAPQQLVKDLLHLLSMGSLTRQFEGEEVTVPLCPTAGQGDLKKILSIAFIDHPAEKLSKSPSLRNALRAAGLWNAAPHSQADKDYCLEHVKFALESLKKKEPLHFITPIQLIEEILLNAYQVSKEEVEFTKKRLKQEAFSHSPLRILTGSDNQADSRLKVVYGLERAKIYFVSTTENVLLKAWEFTLASFSDSKAIFTRWNMYASLGLQPQEPDGIGETIKAVIEKRMEGFQSEIEELEQKADLIYAHITSLEGRASRAASERDIGWLQAEYQARKFEYNRFLTERDQLVQKGNQLSEFYTFFFSFLDQKFKEYFQEIYDPEMLDFTEVLYDDSPAGFRLLYKHGRSNTALWTLIGSSEEFLAALTSFFNSIEVELTHQPQAEGITSVVSELMTAVLIQIKRPEFMKSAFVRLAHAYHERVLVDPLQQMDAISRKPWAYISGGTVGTLLQCYFGSERAKEEKGRWVENEKELIAFLFDTIKELPTPIQKGFLQTGEGSLLATSPTHAFLLKPSWSPFAEGWNSGEYPYTWIRDQWSLQQESFLRAISLNALAIESLVDRFASFFPLEFQERVKKIAAQLFPPYSVSKFRDAFLDAISYEKWARRANILEALSAELDGLLLKHLPFFSQDQLRIRVGHILQDLELNEEDQQNGMELFEVIEKERVGFQALSAQDLLHCTKALLLRLFKSTRAARDFHQEILTSMRKRGYLIPKPLLFADTNWVNNAFAFVVNPGTFEIDLWRMDFYGWKGL